jgi:hypothetical protein
LTLSIAAQLVYFDRGVVSLGEKITEADDVKVVSTATNPARNFFDNFPNIHAMDGELS